MVVEIIGTIIFGAVIGMLARLVLPGRQNISAIVTVILGVLGALIGYWLWGMMGGGDTSGIDWIRWIISIIAAAVLVVAYIAFTGRSRSTSSLSTTRRAPPTGRRPFACPARSSVRGAPDRPVGKACQEGELLARHTRSGSRPPVRGGPCGGCARR